MTSFLIFFFFPGKAENKSLLSLTLYKGGAGSCKLSHRENRCVMLEGAWDQSEERSKEPSPCSTPPCQVRPSGLSDTPFYKWGTWSPAFTKLTPCVSLPSRQCTCCVPVYLAPTSCGCSTLSNPHSPWNLSRETARQTRHAWAQTEASDIFPSEIFLDGWFVMKALTTQLFTIQLHLSLLIEFLKNPEGKLQMCFPPESLL